MKYNYNQTGDFLNDDSFVQWVLLGKNESFWQQYLLENNPTKKELISEARQLILEINDIEGRQYIELDQNLVWSKIFRSIHADEYLQKPVLKLWQNPALKWAASFIIVLGVGWLLLENKPEGKITYQQLVASIENKNTIIEQVNKGNAPLKIKLEDGSIITLERNSKISYPTHFEGDKRAVILSGEAFFEIAKNPTKPFYVYANEVITKVLGTSFRIQALEKDKKVIVKVKAGKVSVYDQQVINLHDPETNALILLPNQQAIYNRNTEGLKKRLVEEPMPIANNSSENLPNQFDEVAVSKILEVIEKRYGVRIIFNEKVLSNCFVTTKLRDESLYNQLDLICKIIGGTYKEVDAQIIIDSKGC